MNPDFLSNSPDRHTGFYNMRKSGILVPESVAGSVCFVAKLEAKVKKQYRRGVSNENMYHARFHGGDEAVA